MQCDVVNVSPRPDFQIAVEYDNGERRRFDMRAMKPWSRIAAPALFFRASVDYGTVV